MRKIETRMRASTKVVGKRRERWVSYRMAEAIKGMVSIFLNWLLLRAAGESPLLGSAVTSEAL